MGGGGGGERPIELIHVLANVPRPCYMLSRLWDLLLIGKSSPFSGGSGLPLLLFEWSFTICPTPINRN